MSAKLLLRSHIDELRFGEVKLPKRFTGLHCVVYLGTAEIAEALWDIKAWDNKADFVSCTPLTSALRMGVKGLLG